MEERKAIVQLKNITKSFGDNQVLKPISLDIYEGEFLTLQVLRHPRREMYT